ncbi:hypothetical protein DXV75_04960 [Alteromonas aestuariivivens]|uniref:Uncharacterized protein n=1 Tax=Alteromonas aestuariivivens TaxID=1938339 RepID=A0A3D8MCH2_9ALTE|nr:hypothetical protein [Alteromonas aestuariivivens]RDV27383.1 hypothetical protein DXV75_04960 [Alteromonas aestuariivivens]
MDTGLKTLDKLIEQHGIRVMEGQDELQSVVYLQGGDRRAVSMKLPFCFYRVIMSKPVSSVIKLHQVYLPYRRARLASFLVDEKGRVMEQVYYQRDSRYVRACRSIQKLVAQAHHNRVQQVA